MLEDDPGITVAGEAGSMAEALVRVPAVRPDLVVVDMRLPDGDGAELCRGLRERGPRLRCLVLTSYSEQDALDAAVRAGASGFLLKKVRGPALVSAVRTVAAGGTLFDDVGAGAPGPAPRAVTGSRCSPTRSARSCGSSARASPTGRSAGAWAWPRRR